MKLEKGMMLDFIRLGPGLIVHITEAYESRLGTDTGSPKGPRGNDRKILTNKYECHVLVEGTMYSMSIVIHWLVGDTHVPRIEWRVLGQQMFARSGLAEVMWHKAKPIDHS